MLNDESGGPTELVEGSSHGWDQTTDTSRDPTIEPKKTSQDGSTEGETGTMEEEVG